MGWKRCGEQGTTAQPDTLTLTRKGTSAQKIQVKVGCSVLKPSGIAEVAKVMTDLTVVSLNRNIL